MVNRTTPATLALLKSPRTHSQWPTSSLSESSWCPSRPRLRYRFPKPRRSWEHRRRHVLSSRYSQDSWRCPSRVTVMVLALAAVVKLSRLRGAAAVSARTGEREQACDEICVQSPTACAAGESSAITSDRKRLGPTHHLHGGHLKEVGAFKLALDGLAACAANERTNPAITPNAIRFMDLPPIVKFRDSPGSLPRIPAGKVYAHPAQLAVFSVWSHPHQPVLKGPGWQVGGLNWNLSFLN